MSIFRVGSVIKAIERGSTKAKKAKALKPSATNVRPRATEGSKLDRQRKEGMGFYVLDKKYQSQVNPMKGYTDTPSYFKNSAKSSPNIQVPYKPGYVAVPATKPKKKK